MTCQYSLHALRLAVQSAIECYVQCDVRADPVVCSKQTESIPVGVLESVSVCSLPVLSVLLLAVPACQVQQLITISGHFKRSRQITGTPQQSAEG